MRPVLLDTSAYVAFKKNELAIVEIFQNAEVIVISPIVIGELLVGFEGGNRQQKNKMELQQFLESSRVIFYPISIDTGQFFSRIYCHLKIKGKPIPTNDMWIAAQAMEHGCVICTCDLHFSFIDGVIAGSSKTEILL